MNSENGIFRNQKHDTEWKANITFPWEKPVLISARVIVPKGKLHQPVSQSQTFTFIIMCDVQAKIFSHLGIMQIRKNATLAY